MVAAAVAGEDSVEVAAAVVSAEAEAVDSEAVAVEAVAEEGSRSGNFPNMRNLYLVQFCLSAF